MKQIIGTLREQIISEVRKTHKSDVVIITEKDSECFLNLYRECMNRNSLNEFSNSAIPNDLFYLKTIPLKNFNFEYLNWKIKITIFDVPINNLNQKIFGAVVMYQVDKKGKIPNIVFPIVNDTDSEKTAYIPKYCAFFGGNTGAYKFALDTMNLPYAQDYRGIMTHFLCMWYGLEIALLNPQVKSAIKSVDKEVLLNNKTSSKKKSTKRRTKYIKVHYINADEIEKRLHKSTREMKCLAWYVIGHWRHYKNGKKTFIQGYWKGALRETKRNQDSGRNRIVESEVIICPSLKPA